MTPTQALPRGRTGARGRNGPREAASTVRGVKGGIRTRFSRGAKYPKSSPPAFVEPRDAANQIEKQILSRRSQRRAAIANPSLVRSAIGIRLAPRSLQQAPRFGRARACASPGIRVSRSGFAGGISNDHAPENKKPSGAAGSEGSCERTVDFA